MIQIKIVFLNLKKYMQIFKSVCQYFLAFFLIFTLCLSAFVLIFTNTSMTTEDLIYRSKYLSQSINELEIMLQAGPFGKSRIVIVFNILKYSYDIIDLKKLKIILYPNIFV